MAFTFDKPAPAVDPVSAEIPPETPAETPLFANPVLTRRERPRSKSRTPLYVGVPIALVVLAGGAVFGAMKIGEHNRALFAQSTTVASASEGSSTPAEPVPAPPASQPVNATPATTPPAPLPPPPLRPKVRLATASEAPVVPAHGRVASHRTARTAEGQGVDVNARAPVEASPPAPPPATMTPSAPTAAPPVITPPPSIESTPNTPAPAANPTAEPTIP